MVQGDAWVRNHMHGKEVWKGKQKQTNEKQQKDTQLLPPPAPRELYLIYNFVF